MAKYKWYRHRKNKLSSRFVRPAGVRSREIDLTTPVRFPGRSPEDRQLITYRNDEIIGHDAHRAGFPGPGYETDLMSAWTGVLQAGDIVRATYGNGGEIISDTEQVITHNDTYTVMTVPGAIRVLPINGIAERLEALPSLRSTMR